jgi:2-polyprenyl-3-methyl-5-hydroxy-6-metoxy-1,4-benzoquinol methylase
MISPRLWNANIHYHALLIQAIPRGAQRVLDVGCGDGILSAQLVRAGVPHVVALDIDSGVLDRARARHAGLSVDWLQADFFEFPFTPGSFDAVVSVATLHHIDAEDALARFAHLVAPGGVVAVIGLAANNWWDLPYAAIARTAQLLFGWALGHWQHSATVVWPPPVTYSEMKSIAERVLPGVRYRRHLLGRYSLNWKKP